jgi:hypothetical protein
MSMGWVVSTKVFPNGSMGKSGSWSTTNLTDRTNSLDALRRELSRTFAEFNVATEIQGWLRFDDCRLIVTRVA